MPDSKIRTIEVDEQRLTFLTYAYFGSGRPAVTASNRAYRDLCRTLRFGKAGGGKYREHTIAVIENAVLDCLAHCKSQDSYDAWHKKVCEKLIDYYLGNNVTFTYGHAQKWINMTMKYLYIHGEINVVPLMPFLHVPIDNYIFEAVEKMLEIKRLPTAWSKIDNYNDYLNYQNEIRNHPAIEIPLRWEFENWLAVSRAK